MRSRERSTEKCGRDNRGLSGDGSHVTASWRAHRGGVLVHVSRGAGIEHCPPPPMVSSLPSPCL